MATKTMKMTEARVRDAGPGEYADTEVKALRLYVSESGAKTWGIYRWDPVKKYPIRKALSARWPDLTVDEAREEGDALAKKVGKGEDLKPPPEPAKESTLGELVQAYTVGLRAKAARAPRWVERVLERGCADWWKKPLSEIRKTDIERLQANIAANRGKAVAAQTVKALRTIFNFAIDNEDEPYSGTNTAKAVKVQNSEPRQRVLSAEETKKVLESLDWEGHMPWIRQYFRLLMLTGVRKSNLGAAQWSEFDLERGVWTIPAAKAKAGKAMEIVLRPEAIEILRERVGLHPVWVFASRKQASSGHMEDPGPAWKRVLDHAGITARITVHDIRRSFGSQLVNAGVPITVVAAAMGHSDARTTMKHYSVVHSNTVRDALARVAAF